MIAATCRMFFPTQEATPSTFVVGSRRRTTPAEARLRGSTLETPSAPDLGERPGALVEPVIGSG
jgi:hypothetical protein